MKKAVFGLALFFLLVFGVSCGGRPAYNTPEDIPPDADAFELYRVGYDFWGRNYYVEVMAGELAGDTFAPLGEELFFSVDEDTFVGSFWEPHVEEQTEKANYRGGQIFYEGYYKGTLRQVDQFYPVPCYYEFSEDGKLIYLDEVKDTFYNGPEDELE